MLIDFKVKDFAIIQKIQVSFESGLNILSGETGAGKSVLVKGLGLLMGGKSSAEDIREGAEESEIEGFFDLSHRKDILETLYEMGIDDAEEGLIVRRQISREGKNRIYLNGKLSTLNHLKNIVSPLVEVTGSAAPLIEMTSQHENKSLQSREYHLDLLDSYAENFPLREQMQEAFHNWNQCAQKIKELEKGNAFQEQQIDFLEFQKKEIESLHLKLGEEVELEEQVKKAQSSGRLLEALAKVEDYLVASDFSAISQLQKALSVLEKAVAWDSHLQSARDRLGETLSSLEEISFDLQKHVEGSSFDFEERERLEEKLSQWRKIQKKYGNSLKEVYVFLDEVIDKLDMLKNKDKKIDELRQQKLGLEKKCLQLASELHSRRTKASGNLVKAMNEELLDLNMKGILFKIKIEQEDNFNSVGNSFLEFMIQNSKSDKPRALGKSASGGELSRILLSLKKVIGKGEYPRTYLFDEVDTGVSGETAEKVGKKLKSISRFQQVICVTHLSQVAVYADTHFFIEKQNSDKGVEFQIGKLSSKERVREIARLLSGEKITETSLKHAQQLMKEASILRM